MSQIRATVVADSINEFGNRLTTLLVVMPRYILAEFNTHRMLSKNSASSRAIPFKKMVEMVKTNPFIPMAWQKDHKGMQGTEYLSKIEKYQLSGFASALIDTLQTFDKESKDYKELKEELDEKVHLIETILAPYKFEEKTLDEWWLFARDKAVEAACIMYVFRVTKQLANRLLEPFMYHTVLVTGTEWENFFHLRCPQYLDETSGKLYKSKSEYATFSNDPEFTDFNTDINWLEKNKGQADIHMMATAEAIYIAIHESTPKELQAGEWHIPFGDKMDSDLLFKAALKSKGMEDYQGGGPLDFEVKLINATRIKVAVARAARTSYTTVGEEGKPDNYEADIALHDRLAKSGHWSCFEHVAETMSQDQYEEWGQYKPHFNKDGDIIGGDTELGWCGNFRGFLQYRKMFANENITE